MRSVELNARLDSPRGFWAGGTTPYYTIKPSLAHKSLKKKKVKNTIHSRCPPHWLTCAIYQNIHSFIFPSKYMYNAKNVLFQISHDNHLPLWWLDRLSSRVADPSCVNINIIKKNFLSNKKQNPGKARGCSNKLLTLSWLIRGITKYVILLKDSF